MRETKRNEPLGQRDASAMQVNEKCMHRSPAPQLRCCLRPQAGSATAANTNTALAPALGTGKETQTSQGRHRASGFQRGRDSSKNSLYKKPLQGSGGMSVQARRARASRREDGMGKRQPGMGAGKRWG